MGPLPSNASSSELFRQPLIEMLNPKHPLVKLADVIDWPTIEHSFGAHFARTRGRPTLPPRLVAGLLYLQHAYDCSDEAVVNTWIETPYFPYFTGETDFPTELPIDPSSLTRWRQRIGAEGVETMVAVTIDAARRIGLVKGASVDKVIVDTPVMPEAIAHPTDSRLLELSRQRLVKLAIEQGLSLRQNYNRQAPRLAAQIGRYAHAKQFKRMKKALRTLKTRVGRVHREVSRQIDHLALPLREKALDWLVRTGGILSQQTKDKRKLYALHAPEVECVSKGKERTLTSSG